VSQFIEDKITKKDIKIGMLVDIDCNGEVSRGHIVKVITSTVGNKGIKVLLKNGKSGRVIEIPKDYEIEIARMKALNTLFHAKTIFSIWDNKNRKYITVDTKYGNIAFLWTDSGEASKYIEKKSLEGGSNSINRKKMIIENFKSLNVDYFVINNKLKVSLEKLNELEIQFKNLLR